ncbi:hypothetical protein HYC85_011771, partial [Camellia sinensis]
SKRVTFKNRIGNLGGGIEYSAQELGKERKKNKYKLLGLDQLVMPEELENTIGSSPVVQQHKQRETVVNRNLARTMNRVKNRWLSRLRSMTCVVDDRQGVTNNLRPIQGARVQRVKVFHSRKQCKELFALFMGQNIQAHEGSILTMKFSLDRQFLATAGKDRIVHINPSCIYFTVNHLSELSPLITQKEKFDKLKSLKKMTDSAFVIFPLRVFRILEKPLHQFNGNNDDILDLSWSKTSCLLSSSIDETVRLWQVGCEHCLKFNLVDNNQFISGSIDGKVWIWAITSCQVVNWTYVKDIITAVCYRHNGKGVIVGSMKGTCHFYDMSVCAWGLIDVLTLVLLCIAKKAYHCGLDARIDLHSKKKAPCKRIIGFQFFPRDPSKLMVTCADSQVRIIRGYSMYFWLGTYIIFCRGTDYNGCIEYRQIGKGIEMEETEVVLEK